MRIKSLLYDRGVEPERYYTELSEFIKENTELMIDVGMRDMGLSKNELSLILYRILRLTKEAIGEEVLDNSALQQSLANAEKDRVARAAMLGSDPKPNHDSPPALGSQIEWLRDKGRFSATYPPTPGGRN